MLRLDTIHCEGIMSAAHDQDQGQFSTIRSIPGTWQVFVTTQGLVVGHATWQLLIRRSRQFVLRSMHSGQLSVLATAYFFVRLYGRASL